MIGKYALETARKMGVAEAVAAGDRSRAGAADLGGVARRLDHRPQPGGDLHGVARARPAPGSGRGRHRDVGAGAGRQADGGRQVGRRDLRRRRAQELSPPDGAAAARDSGRVRTRPRLLHPDHRRAARHGRAVGRDAGRSGVVGQDRSRSVARHGGRLPRLHGGDAADGVVRARALQAAQAAPPVQAVEGDGGGAARRVPQIGSVQALLARRGRRGAPRARPPVAPPAASPLSGKPLRRTRR